MATSEVQAIQSKPKIFLAHSSWRKKSTYLTNLVEFKTPTQRPSSNETLIVLISLEIT